MTNGSDTAIETARLRVLQAKEKFERQQKRYAIRALAGTSGSDRRKLPPETLEAKALMTDLEAELEASQKALLELTE